MASVEIVKRQGLAGGIAGTLSRAENRFEKDDTQRLKHFGIYQQQDGNMVRLKIPGGRFSTAQYLAVTDIALRYANRQFMITTRQDVQFHTVRPQHLRTSSASLMPLDHHARSLWRRRTQRHHLPGE
jgi:sulfite reductase beta subunit-like hemoprotein